MRTVAAISSIALHGALLIGMSVLADRAILAAPSTVEMRVVPKPPPPIVEEKVEEIKKEEVIPPPTVKPKLVKKPTVEKSIPDEPKPAEQPIEKPKIPPQGFSVDMSNTVNSGNGVAVQAVEGGGNMFANPNDKALPPGKKTNERPPEQGGSGKGTAPADSYQITRMPEWLGKEKDRTPPYPPEARDREIEGQVLLKVYVNAEGRVAQVRIIQKLYPSCDEVAEKWAKEKFRFKPAMLGDQPVGMWIDVPVTFVIDR
jgi:periplasmic protein TonB